MNQSFNTVLCQSCGASNKDTEVKCTACGAVLPGRLMEREEQRAKEKLLSSFPDTVAEKIRQLEKELVERPDATAILIQLSNLYKGQGVKDMAVEYMEKASALDPANKFLQQKLRLMIDGEQAQTELVETIRARESETRKGVRLLGIGVGVVALVLLLVVLKLVLFPSSFRIAKGGKNMDAVAPKFSSDGTKIAYLEAPRFTVFGALDALESPTSTAEIWIAVKPVKGDAKRIVDMAKMNVMLSTFAWRPGHDEITFSGWIVSDGLDSGHHIYLVPAEGGTPKKIATGRDFAWSRDGGKLAYVKSSWMIDGKEGLFVMDVDAGFEQHVSGLDCSHPSWSPVTDDLVFQGRDQQRLMDAATALLAGQGSAEAEDLFDTYVGDLYRYDSNTGQVTQITQEGTYRSPQFTPDGGKIAALQYSEKKAFTNTLVTLNPDGGDLTILLEPGDQYAYFGDFDFSPDGRVLAFEGFFENPDAAPAPQAETPLGMMGGGVNYVSDIFTVSADGSEVTRLASGKHKFKKNPVFSPDGSLLAYEVMYLNLGRDIWAMKR